MLRPGHRALPPAAQGKLPAPRVEGGQQRREEGPTPHPPPRKQQLCLGSGIGLGLGLGFGLGLGLGLGLALTLALTLTLTLTPTCPRCERVEAEPARRQCAALRGRQPGGDLDEQIVGLDAVTEKGVTGWHGL